MENKDIDKITQSIMQSDGANIDEDLQLFNAYMLKKSAVRAAKYDGLMDNVLKEMQARLENRSEMFDNADLLKYLQVLQDASEKSILAANGESSIPQIKITQNNVNMSQNELSRESREKVLDFINNVLKQSNDKIEVEGEVTDNE